MEEDIGSSNRRDSTDNISMSEGEKGKWGSQTVLIPLEGGRKSKVKVNPRPS